MARTWLTLRVELVSGREHAAIWPRPGRILIARPGMTFRDLADAINVAFARWELAHLHEFRLADGTRIALRGPWDTDDDALDDRAEKLTRLALGEQLVYVFDLGDAWTHLVTVGDEKVDPVEAFGRVPERPVPVFGWGDLPDQHGCRWLGDDGASPMPARPDPPLGDLPDLARGWGSDAQPMPWLDGGDVRDGEAVVTSTLPWRYEHGQELRRAVHARDVEAVLELLAGRDPLAVAQQVTPFLVEATRMGDREARTLVEELCGRLDRRAWLGDAELAGVAGRALRGEDEPLQATPVHLDDVADVLDGRDDTGESARLYLRSGELVRSFEDDEGLWGDLDDEELDRLDDEPSLEVLPLGSRNAYADMQDFAATVEDDRRRVRLEIALHGKGAFRRFKDLVHDDEDLAGPWSMFQAERRLGRARWWLAEEGWRPGRADEA